MIEFTPEGRAITGICDYCSNQDGDEVVIVNEEEFICTFCINAMEEAEKAINEWD